MESKNVEIVMALGCNVNQFAHIGQANGLLRELFGDIVFSEAVWTDPVGLDSDRFVNQVAVARTPLPLEAVQTALKKVEALCGRTVMDKARGIIAMDIDLLAYNGKRYKEEDWQRDYIRRLLDSLHYVI